MRRSSAGYVKSLNEDEFTSGRKASWKMKRLFSKKQSSKHASVPSASERPLLEQVVSSEDIPDDDILPSSSSVYSSHSEPSSRMSSPVSAAVTPEQRPTPSEQHHLLLQDTHAPPPTKQEQSPQDQVIQRVKKKLNATPTKQRPSKSTITQVVEQEPLPSLPKTPPRQTTDEMTKVRAALSRPFGRNNLPPHLASNWVVEVSPAEWDAEEEGWKYRILVQKRSLANLDESMTTAFTWRSLADFMWLEQALRAEYHGALLLPLLSIAIGTPDVVNFTQEDVDASLLKGWLCDVLNGIRGQGTNTDTSLLKMYLHLFSFSRSILNIGELVLHQEEVDLSQSEAMEAFLYRNTRTSLVPSPGRRSANISQLDDSFTNPGNNTAENKDSFVDSLWAKPFDCLPLDNLCDGRVSSPPRNSKNKSIPMAKMACSSRALGDAYSFQVQDSFADAFDPDPEPIQSSALAIHSELLEAERELVYSYRKAAMAAMDKGRSLIEEETQASTAWKRFAISLSALYAYEKDIEGLRIEEVKKKRPNYRKLGKTNVEELLRLMTKQKTERTVPALRSLDAMLSAYVGDLSAVNPAIKTYSEAIMQLSTLNAPVSSPKHLSGQRSVSSSSTKESWQNSVRHMANDVKKQITGESVKSEATTSTAISTDAEGSINQKRAFEARVLKNERLLRDSLTALCRSTSIRVARMAWKSFSIEAAQASLLKSCAHSMRTKVNILDRNALADMIERHKKESIEDSKAELDLVERIITIEDYKKVPCSGDSASTDGNDEDDAFNDDKKQALLRSEAMELVRGRVGRWDSKVGLAIMKAVGAEEGEVRVDETTRELRIVRKFAIGLREQLGRCAEALDVLKGVVYHGDPDALIVADDDAEPPEEQNYLRDARQQFVDDITDVFSGAFVTGSTPKPRTASTSMSVLSKAGIELEDPAGWSSAVIPSTKSSSKRKIVPVSLEMMLIFRFTNSSLTLTSSMDYTEETTRTMRRTYRSIHRLEEFLNRKVTQTAIGHA